MLKSPSTNTATVDEYVKARDEALANLDLEWARNQCGGGSDEMLLVALHKSRYDAVRIAPELRHASRKWLEERGYKRIGGLPWPADGSLPK
jgi:hypothetical protein